MLSWWTTRDYNRFDAIWIGLVALAIRDRQWFAVVVFALIGAALSDCLEAWNKSRRMPKGGARL